MNSTVHENGEIVTIANNSLSYTGRGAAKAMPTGRANARPMTGSASSDALLR
jgi:hypothetical protein